MTPTCQGDSVYEVHKYEYPAPLADGWLCTCGRPVRYNLCVGTIRHADDGTSCPGDLDAPIAEATR